MWITIYRWGKESRTVKQCAQVSGKTQSEPSFPDGRIPPTYRCAPRCVFCFTLSLALLMRRWHPVFKNCVIALNTSRCFPFTVGVKQQYDN